MGIRSSAGRQRVGGALRGCRRRHPLLACRRSATSGTTSSTRSSRPARRRRLHNLRDFSPVRGGRGPTSGPYRVAHQGRCLRRPRRKRMGLLRVHEEYVDAFVAIKSRRRSGRTASWLLRRTTPGRVRRPTCSTDTRACRGMGQGRRSPSSARCSVSTSPGSPALRRRTRPGAARRHTQISALTRGDGARWVDGDRQPGPHHRSADQANQEGRSVGHRDGRGPCRRDRVPPLPSSTTVQTMLHQDVVAVVRGKRSNRREDSIAINARAHPARES